MRWASHLSTYDTIEACVERSIGAVRKQMGGEEIHLTLVFVASQFKGQYEEVPKLIRDKMDPGW